MKQMTRMEAMRKAASCAVRVFGAVFLLCAGLVPAQEVELNYNGRIKSGGMKSASGLAPGLCAITDLVAAPRDSQTSIGHPPPGGGHLGLDTVHDLADNHNPALRSLG
jgi:hypothetical protein